MDTILDIPFGDDRLSVEIGPDGAVYVVRLSEPGGGPGALDVVEIPARALRPVADTLARLAMRNEPMGSDTIRETFQ